MEDTAQESNQLIYLYAFVPSGQFTDNPMPELEGIEPPEMIQYEVHGDITAVTCRVPEDVYSEAKLQRKVEDMQWLQVKAFHHHELMNKLHENYTVIPLKFGTIFETEETFQAMITEKKTTIMEQFQRLSDKEEWNLKVYAAKDKFMNNVVENSEEMEQKKADIEAMPKGRQFFEKKKLANFAEEKAIEKIRDYCQELHDHLKSLSEATDVKKNWERKVTGRDEDMSLNSVYLVNADGKKALLDYVEAEKQYAEDHDTGFYFEMTGPWPSYHFSDFAAKGEEKDNAGR